MVSVIGQNMLPPRGMSVLGPIKLRRCGAKGDD